MADLQDYKCPACGGAIGFDSSIQKMKCPYCDTEFEMETLKAFDEELKNQPPDDMHWERPEGEDWSQDEIDKMTVYGCKSWGRNCGRRHYFSYCLSFCDNPVVVMGRFTGALRPNYIIPFKLDKNAAKEGLYNHLKASSYCLKYLRTKII